MTSANRHPGVEDSIELDNGDEVTRRASENLPKVLGRTSLIDGIVTEYGRRRKRRPPEDADARDGDRYDRNGLAMKRLIPAERRSPRSIAREKEQTSTLCKE